MLDPGSADQVLEIGCGPGVAAAVVCERLTTGRLLAVDRSAVAARRTAEHVAGGRLEVRNGGTGCARPARTQLRFGVLDQREPVLDPVTGARAGDPAPGVTAWRGAARVLRGGRSTVGRQGDLARRRSAAGARLHRCGGVQRPNLRARLVRPPGPSSSVTRSREPVTAGLLTSRPVSHVDHYGGLARSFSVGIAAKSTQSTSGRAGGAGQWEHPDFHVGPLSDLAQLGELAANESCRCALDALGRPASTLTQDGSDQ